MSKKSKSQQSPSSTVMVAPASPTVTFNVQALQALGVETKISKADLMEYITTQIEEQLLAVKNDLASQLDAYEKDFIERINKVKKAFEAKMLKNTKINKYIDAKLEFLVIEYEFLSGEMRNYQSPSKEDILRKLYNFSLKSNKIWVSLPTQTYHNNYVLECKSIGLTQEVILYTDEEFNEIDANVRRIKDEQCEVKEKLANLGKQAKAARMEMLKTILGGTTEGQTLLNFLDGHARNFKALTPQAS